MNKSFLTLIIILYSSTAFVQQLVPPVVNEKMQDYVFYNPINYNKPSFRISDFEGKWLFLDFWTLRCKACIKSFPKINQLQNAFKDNVQFIMVGNNDKNNPGIEKVFEQFKAKYDLKMIAVYDSVLKKAWEISTVPHIYIIDPKGKLRFITSGFDFSIEKIQALLNGEEVSFHNKDFKYFDFISSDDDIQNLNVQNVLQSSLLSKWNGERQTGGHDLNSFSSFSKTNASKGWYITAVPLYVLYKYAYIGNWLWMYYNTDYHGKFWDDPIIEVKDSSLFQFDYYTNEGTGLYNLYVKVPYDRLTTGYIQNQMQQLLKSIFGYRAYLEERDMPVWRFVVKPGAKNNFITKSDKPFLSAPPYYDGFTAKNMPIDRFLHMITFNLVLPDKTVFINETKINSNIDFTIKADMTDIESVRKSLQEGGFDLIKGVKKMKVLIITDP